MHLEETEPENVDNEEVVGPVQDVKDNKEEGEEDQGHPIHPLIRHLDLFSYTPTETSENY